MVLYTLSITPHWCLAKNGPGYEFYKKASAWSGSIDTRPNAVGLIDKAIALEPKNAEYVMLKANLLVDMEEAEEALPVIEQALKMAPNSPLAWQTKGKILMDMRDYKGAENCCNQSLKLDPSYVDAHKVRARILMRQNRFDQALSEIKFGLNAITDGAILADWQRDALHCYMHLHDWKNAIAMATTIAHSGHFNHQYATYFDRGRAHAQLKHYQDAVNDFKSAAHSEPFNPKPHVEMAAIYRILGDSSKAAREQKLADSTGLEYAPGRTLGR